MLIPILCVVGGILLGAGIYFLITRLAAANLIKKAEEEAEVMKKNKIVEAKEKFIAPWLRQRMRKKQRNE